MDKKQTSNQREDKQPYCAPRLVTWGDVADLTRLGRSGGPGDAKFANGSVFPPPFST